MIIAVDFDGTLFSGKWPEIGTPNLKMIQWCKEQKEKGNILILWTCRHGKNLKKAVKACKELGLEFDKVNDHDEGNLKKYGTLLVKFKKGAKIFADMYIDDKAYRPEEIINGDNYGKEE